MNVQKPGDRNRDEPDHHHRSEETRHPRRSSALPREQADQDGNGQRHDVVLERGRDELQSFDRRQHGNRRRDHRVAQEHGSADDAEQEDQRGAPPECARRQRGQGQRAALPVVVGPQQQQHVFDRDHDDQRPQDQRQHAEHDVAGDRPGFDRRDHRHAKRVKRARADVAVDDADAAERQRPQARFVLKYAIGSRRGRAGRGLFVRYLGHGAGSVSTHRKRGAPYITTHPLATCPGETSSTRAPRVSHDQRGATSP